MQIEILNIPDPACDAFVGQKTESKICHLPAWSDVVTKVTRHRPFYLVACEGGEIRGVLPLTQVRSRLFGNRMISQAFSNYGGPLAENPLALSALYEKAVELATENGCQSIELRNVDPLPFDLHLRKDKITMYLPLAPDPDTLWKSLKSEIRNRVRKAEKADISVSDGGPELLDAFYSVWTIRMRQLGTPCYPKRLFQGILDAFAGNTRIFLVYLDQLVIGGAFVYLYNGLVQMRWVATLNEYNYLSPNVLLYWTVINHYCLAGASCFDFGRSTVGSTQHEFKRRWGAKPVQLHYQYWCAPGKELSLATPNDPKYSKKVEIWKKLPLWMTRLVGPYISRSLP
jgi:FemAB-related protein (PEP-CTERM system-associated)